MKSALHAMVLRGILRSLVTLSLCANCAVIPAQSQDAEVTPQVQQLYAQAQAESEAAPNGADGDGPTASADDEEVVDAEVVDEDK